MIASIRGKMPLFLFLTGLQLLIFWPEAIAGELAAKEKMYWLSFTDKGEMAQNLEQIFDEKALERRRQGNISFDESDFPVCEKYLQSVEKNTQEIIGYSKWFNGCAVLAGESQVEILKTFAFVKSIHEIILTESTEHAGGPCKVETTDTDSAKAFSKNQKKILKAQQESMGLPAWQGKGISGKGIRVAVFDAGFPKVDRHPAFEHLRKNKRIIDTKNFLTKTPEVYGRNFHGEAVLSCIAGIYREEKLGVGTDAEFLLALTEYAVREPFREELFWLMAAEWADEKGAHIISSSLGYGYQRYFFKDMNGKSSLVARAAGMAVRKGILVINSAGNEGTDSWKTIITPADQDSVLSVGGVDSKTGYHIDFSSYGPNANGNVKPNLCAPGDVMAARGMGISNIQGTSFSCPLISGFAACLLQFQPELIGKPIQAMRFLEEHSSLFPYFDYAHGYGVPDATSILNEEKVNNKSEFMLKDASVKKEIEISFTETADTPYFTEDWEHALYVKFLDDKNRIIAYELYDVQPFTKEISAEYGKYQEVTAVEVHYAGSTKKIILNHFSH